MEHATNSVLSLPWYTEFEMPVIIGSGFYNIDEIRIADDERTIIIFHSDAERITDISIYSR